MGFNIQNTRPVISFPFGISVQRGLVDNFSAINKFGFNDLVPTSFEVLALGSANFTYPTSAGVVTVVSDDTDDTSDGTGARTIKLEGLDGDYNPITETLTMNGTTNVVGSETFLRLFRMSVETAGSNGGLEGTITATIGGNEMARMESEYDNQTLQANYTIPRNKRGYLTRIQITSTKDNKEAMVGLFTRELNSVFKVKQLVEIYRNNIVVDFPAPLLIPEKTDIELKAKNLSSGNVSIGATFDLFLEDL